MTIARAEMSTNLQSPEAQGTKGMSVALIGPNDAHRKVVAKALASAQGRKVHEFIDYPADLNDLARMMETKFDVVLVDVDTDESYALQIIAKLADFGPAVMAYSARSDQELLASCMRAGAVDFLPLPSEDGVAPEPPRPAAAPVVQQVAPKAAPARPAAPPPPPPPASRASITSIHPEKADEPVREVRPAASAPPRFTPAPAPFEPAASSAPVEQRQPENEHDDFAAWDKANLRPATPIPITKTPERPRPSLVPDRRKSETAPPRVAPAVEEAPAPAPPVDRPPVPVELFRSATFQSEPDEAAEKQGANWVKWILIGAGPVVLGLVLLLVFTRPSTSTANPAASATTTKEAPAAPAEPKPTPGSQLIVNATGKSAPAATNTAKPSPANQASEPAQPDTPQVSSDAMAQQLVAPSRIAGNIRKTSDEPPSAAPAPVSLDEGSPISGSVFGANAKVKVAPHVVPISAGVADGMIIRKTPPVYPRFAQEAHITGKVVLKATITKQGNIEGVQVLSGPKILAPAAADAVKTWKYRPYMLDGQPVSVETNITVVFGENGR